MYNQRELRHMLDVKIVVGAAIWVLYGSLAVLISAGFWAFKQDWVWDYRLALARGGRLTAGLIVVLILALILSFDWVFVGFHKIFFEGDTWIFRYSDTLIRLFPVRFWQDAFITVGVLALLGGALLGYFAARPVRD